MTRATILIPAHNEAAVIGRTLLHLSRGLSADDFPIVVIANACADATATKARSVLPTALVIETDVPGKCNALNLGYEAAAKDCPVVCLDADLDVTAESIKALVAPLLDGTADAACGKMTVRTDDAASIVRAYYKGWRLNPYFDNGKFGGLFALSPAAAVRIFPLPKLTADDEYVRRSVPRSQTAFVPSCQFTARAPATLASLCAVRRRSLRGAREVAKMGLPTPEKRSLRTVLQRAIQQPSVALPMIVYGMVNGWVRLALAIERGARRGAWERDLTTRLAG